MNLFGEQQAKPKPDIQHWRGIFAEYNLEELVPQFPLKQNVVNMYGKTFPAPRLECWHGLRPYSFGGRVEQPMPWPRVLELIKTQAECLTSANYDSCFVNYYRDGDDMIAWHSDDEAFIGKMIASVSFGVTRKFVMRLKSKHEIKHEWHLEDGSLFLMRDCQREWEHTVPRQSGISKPRLNLTFRQTVGGG